MRRSFRRTFGKVCASLLGAALVAGSWVIGLSPDPEYAAYEIVFHARFHRYDAIIRSVARRLGIDPMLVKAVIWRESRFRPGKMGQDGERGLMQLTEAAASEWVKATKVEGFTAEELFDPKVNIEAGAWLLARALKRYETKDNPLPFALAEYNAGRSRVIRWTDKAASAPAATSHELQANIDIASTRNYVASVQNRVRFYHRRDRL